MDSELKEIAANGKAADVKGESEMEHRPLLKSESMISGADLLPLGRELASMDSELKEIAANGKAADVQSESEREHRPLLKSESMISGADLLPLGRELASMDSELKEIAANGKAADVKGESEREHRPLLKSESMISSSSMNGEAEAEAEARSSSHDPDPDPDLDLEKKYAAFFRCDSYGPMGRGDISLKEKLLLALALLTLIPLRLFLGLAIVCSYYLICRSLTLFCIPNSILLDRDRGSEGEQQEGYAHTLGWRRSLIVMSGRFFSRSLLFVFGFYSIPHRYHYQGPPRPVSHECESINLSEDAVRPGAIISNHVSYLDILYHMSASFPSFVAKRSVAKLPLVGLISKCLGCVFVQRESKTSDFKGVSGVVTERVQAAHEDKHAPMMMLFPEGTTTNGGFLLPFKTGAFLSKAPVLPVILRYPYKRFSPAWDSISGVRHLIFLLCQFVNYMEVIRLPVYYPSEQEREDPKLYANNVRKLMASEGKLILSDIGLPEKRIYHAALNGLFSRS